MAGSLRKVTGGGDFGKLDVHFTSLCIARVFFYVNYIYPRGIMIFWFLAWMVVLRRLGRIQQGRSQASVCQVRKLVTPKHLAGERQGNGIPLHGCRFGGWRIPIPRSVLILFSYHNLGCGCGSVVYINVLGS